MPKNKAERSRASSESSSPSTGTQLQSFLMMYGVRRDSGGSSTCDRRDSTESSSRGSETRRESTESERRVSVGSRGSGGRDRRYSEGNEPRDSGEPSEGSPVVGTEDGNNGIPIPGKKKNSIFRQIMKWGSPRRNSSSKTSGGGCVGKKCSKEEQGEVDVDNNESSCTSKSGGSCSEEGQRKGSGGDCGNTKAVPGTTVIPIILQRCPDEKVRYYNPPPYQSSSGGASSGLKGGGCVAKLNVTGAPMPRRKHNSNSAGSTSIPTEELLEEDLEGGSLTSLSHEGSSCTSSGSFSTSGSGSGTDENGGSSDEEDEAEGILGKRSTKGANKADMSPTIPHRFDGSSSTYYSYYPDYRRSYQYQYQQHPPPQVSVPMSASIDCAGSRSRARSRSLDLNNETRRYLRRRRLSENQEDRAQDNSQTHKTYTIYESIIQDGARRFSLHSHRPSDMHLDPAHAAILFRDSRGLPSTDPFLERVLNLKEEEENEILVKFFKFHKCYDLIPTSAKLVVFDTQLLVKKAFFALVYNGVRAAPLWDSTVREFVGMLTITDFIRVLHAMYHDSAGKMSELEEHRVETWRSRFLQDKQPLIYIDPDASLYDAICSLVNNRIHRLPVIDKHTGNVLHILTHKRILKFLFLYIHEIPRPSFMNKRLREVKIGTFEDVETAREETPIIVALQKFLDKRVSALPIVDDQNRLLDIYARFDVINLAAEKTYNNLDITLKQANEHRNEWFEGVHKCTLDDTLYAIMEKQVKAEVHRLVVVDEQDRVVGIVSLSDILQYLVMRPELKEVTMADVEAAMCPLNNNESESESPPPQKVPPASEIIQQFQHKFEVLKLDENELLGNHRSESLDNDRENPTIMEEEDDHEKT